MAEYELIALVIGVVLILSAWLPITLERHAVSLPIVLVAFGAVLFALPGTKAGDPRDHLRLTMHLTEAGVLVALLGAGLSIDRRVGLRRWAPTWRLLSVGMLASIAGIAAVGSWVLGLPLAAALLFGAVLAPTDPVLASDVQVGEPVLDEAHLDDEDDVRFSLTSEAGLNDGLAFPFVWAAIALGSTQGAGSWGQWFAEDLVLRIAVGAAVGAAIGSLLGWLAFSPPRGMPGIATTSHGFVALGATTVTYFAAEMLHGYGFLAVFVCAVMMRHWWRTEDYHAVLHQFAGEIEQVVSSALLVLFGGALVSGLLAGLDWRQVAAALAILLVVRPIAGHLALTGSPIRSAERRAIAFFGIRGVGSMYYLSFAAVHGLETQASGLWTTVSLTILLSITLHGVTASGVMRRLDARRARRHRGHRRHRPPSDRPPAVRPQLDARRDPGPGGAPLA